MVRTIALALVVCYLSAVAAEPDQAQLHALAARLAPLHLPKIPPEANDWLARQKEEGQTFDQFRALGADRPTPRRRTLYVQPIGTFDVAQRALVSDVGAVLGAAYGVPVTVRADLDLGAVPAQSRRLHPTTGTLQLRADHLLDRLAGAKPANALSVLGLITTDLWPGENWNYVFGMATPDTGVGVWSLARLIAPGDRLLTLRRTLKLSVHESGHMFGLMHCIRHECVMNGANHLREADRTPLWFCPECAPKVWWACRLDPATHCRGLAEFAAGKGLDAEAAHWRRSAELLAGP